MNLVSIPANPAPEGATTGRGLIKSDQFQTFVRQHEDSLRAVLTPEQFATLRNVADDLQRANRSLTAVKIPGQSNTAQDFYATMEGASRLGQLMANLASGGVTGGALIIVGEEALTDAGEILCFFITELIPDGLSLGEAAALTFAAPVFADGDYDQTSERSDQHRRTANSTTGY